MRKLLFLCLVVTSCVAQKGDTLKLVKASEIAVSKTATIDEDVVIISPYEVQKRMLILEDLAVKNGWTLQNKYGVLTAKDVEQFKTLVDAKLSSLYTLDILKRFAESLKISTIGTKAVLVKNIKAKVISI